MNVLTDPKKNMVSFEGVSQEILRETSPHLSPEERDQIRKARENEGMLEYYGAGKLNHMVSYLKSNSINKIRSREIYLDLEVAKIFPMEDQPRKYFDQESLEDLKSSIEEKGLSTPILVRRCGEYFQIIAGERRWRAFKELGKNKIPAIIKDVQDEKEAYILAAIENLQRENLNVIEEALCYQRMLDQGAVESQRELAAIVGRNKSRISERLSLLKLPELVKRFLARKEGGLSEGHGIELLRLREEEKMVQFAENAIEEKWSRDQLRQAINQALAGQRKSAGEGIKEEEPKGKMLDIARIFAPIREELEKEMKSPTPELELGSPSASFVRYSRVDDYGFDLVVSFRPHEDQKHALGDIMEDLAKRLKEMKKLRKELKRMGLAA